MGSLKRLEKRLACLEARVGGAPNEGGQKMRYRTCNLYELHVHTWATGRSFEDIPEKDREPSLWEEASKYGPVFLGLVGKGVLPGHKDLLAAGVDFTRAMDVGGGIVGKRRNQAPTPTRRRKP